MVFPAHFPSLKVALSDWVEGDVAEYYLACSLGIMKPEDGSLDGFRRAKHVFWSRNELGESLRDFMQNLVERGVLEFDDSGGRYHYRWNPTFKGSWEA